MKSDELRIVSTSEGDIEVEGGFDETFARILVSELLEMDDVEMAECIVEHPLTSSPKIYLRAKKGAPRDLLIKAAKRIRERSKELQGKLGAVG